MLNINKLWCVHRELLLKIHAENCGKGIDIAL